MKKYLSLLLLFLMMFVCGSVRASEEKTITLSQENITLSNGNKTATWQDDYMTYTLTGGTLTWDNTNKCYTLAAATTYTLKWSLTDANNVVKITKVVGSSQTYRNRNLTDAAITYTAGTTKVDGKNYSGIGNVELNNLSLDEKGSVTIKTAAATSALIQSNTYRLKSITLTYTIAKPFQFSATAKAGENGNASVSFDQSNWSSTATTSVKASSVTATSASTSAWFKAETTAANYEFAGWSETEGGEIVSKENPYKATINSTSQDPASPTDKTLYANFAKTSQYSFSVSALTNVIGDVEVSATLSNGEEENTVVGVGSASETATFKAKSNTAEYEFVGWSENAAGTSIVSTDATYVVNLTNNVDESTVTKVLYAIFHKQEVYTLTVSAMRNITAGGKVSAVFDSNGKSSIQITGTSARENATFTAYANAGYHFVGWSETANGTIISTNTTYQVQVVSINPEAPTTKVLYANFEEDAAPALDKNNYYTKMIVKQHTNSPKGAGVIAVLAGNDTSDNETAPSLDKGTYANEAYLIRKATTDNGGEQTTYDNKYWVLAKANPGYEFVGWAADLTTSFRAKANPYEQLVSIADLTKKGSDQPAEKVLYAEFRKIVEASGDEDIKAPTTVGKMTLTPGNGSVVSSIETIYVTTNGTTEKKQYRNGGTDLGARTLTLEQQYNGSWIAVGTMNIGSYSQPTAYEFKYPFTISPRVTSPGTYRVVIPKNTYGIYANNKWGDFCNPEDLVLNLTIPGDVEDAAIVMAQSASNPASNAKFVDALSTVSLTYPVVVKSADNDALSIYTDEGDYVCNSYGFSLSNDRKTITFRIPTLSYGNYYVALEPASVRGDGWESAEINESEHNIHFSVVQDLKPELVWTEGTWKIENLTFEAKGHDNIEVCYQRMHNNVAKNDIYIYNKATGVATTARLAASNKTEEGTEEFTYLKYNGNKVTMSFFLKNVLLGAGTYYFDIPAQTFCSDGIYNENPIHYEFTLAETEPTNFTVSPAAGSTVSKISQIKLTINDAKTGIAVKNSNLEYLWVSKDGAEPIKYNIFEYERDGDTSGGNEYGSATQLTVDGKTATIAIADGFATALGGYDYFGYASSGTYTITVPAGLFYIDGLEDYTNTDMTFTYVVKNNVIESRVFKGNVSLVSPSDEELYVDMATELSTIVLHVEDAASLSIPSLKANINNGEMILNSYDVDGEAMTVTLHMVPGEGKTLMTSGTAKLTVTGDFEVNGRLYAMETNADEFGDYYNIYDDIVFNFGIQTMEEKLRSNIIITPETGSTLESMSIMRMDIREPEKLQLYTHAEGVKVPLMRNGEESGYYVMWASAKVVSDAGLTETVSNQGLRVTDAAGNTVEVERGGEYSFELPEGFFTMQNKTTFEEVPSKVTIVAYSIPNPAHDYNADGLITISDVTKYVDDLKKGVETDEAEIDVMVNKLLKK